MSKIIFTELASKPPAPSAGQVSLYVKTDEIVYIQDSAGTEIPLGSAASITNLYGDVTANGPGNVPSTVNFVGGATASDIAAATATVDAATSSNTASTLVKRDASGNFSAGTITANLVGNASTATSAISFTGSLSGDVTGTQSATVVSFVGGSSASAVHTAELLANAATSSNTASTLVKRDASGNFSAGTITANLVGNASTATSAISFTGSLSGDVTGTQSATVVASVGGATASDIAAATATVDAATFSNTASTLVKRDASGNFSANIITAALSGNATTSTSAISFTGSLSGDVAGTQSATVIQANVVSNGKLAQMPTNTIKGNNTGVTANALDLTIAQVNTMLGNVTSIGTYDLQTPQANGLDIVGNSLFAQSASVSVPGMVNISTQSFAGNKTFTGTVAITANSTSALAVNTSSFIFDSTNNVLGIGLQPSTAVMIDGLNTTGSSKLVQMTGYGVGSTTGYRGRFARGTLVSPSAVQSGDILSAISGRGYGASQFAAASTGAINVVAGETFTNTSNLTYLQFSTTPTASVTAVESMRVASSGVTLGPQSSSAAKHQINGGLSGTTRTITSSTFTVDTTTTDYIIYTDSTSNAIAVTLPVPTSGRILVIEDSTGKAFTNNITINPSASEKINGASTFIISQNYGSVRLTSDGTNWFIQALPPNVAATIQSVVPISSTVIDWSLGNMYTKTLSANTTFTFSNATAGQTLVIRLTNTASNYTVTWPSMKWPVQTSPVMTVGAFSDIYTILYDGTNYYGSYVQNF